MSKQASIMIVEDESVMAMYLEMALKREGFEICALAETGEDAITESEKKHPDVVLMDIRLGGEIDGIAAAQEIIHVQKSRILFMTGYSNIETKQRAQKLHPVAYLVKPFEISELITILRSLHIESGI